MMTYRIFLAMCCLAVSSSVFSESLTELVYDTANRYGLNPVVFHSMITQESGDPKNGLSLNPNALNIGGLSKYPASKEEAYELILNALGEGHDTVGVGLGQVEWRYHSDKFFSLWEALEPEKNIDVAAGYLKEMVKYCKGNIACGVGAYHNRTYSIGKGYVSLVANKCERLYGKDKCAELRQGY
ncbi:transglycosylase SLT domain-containing protein [Vibrio campbellii]|uniref:transglycosylase SLT domain-containing protein n=1 Tax=Vibrio harveyi group TaxID=717610 RepID=UPI0018F24D03|nr:MULTISPECIES: transglycosylase SLT domain-containing protein [Vibrio harveyi group]MCR9909683.1 transglycosylase SLT domain-containing protein [Vibrio campbellii]